MKRLVTIFVVLLSVLSTTAVAEIQDFLASSNQFGYQGTISNTTDGTGPWSTPTPRDGTLFFTKGVPGYDAVGYNNYNQVLSNWFQHSPSNQTPGFFQLAGYMDTVTSATAAWSEGDGGLWDFTFTVSGAGANYRNSTARLWEPDISDSAGGEFIYYTYTVTATGMQTSVIDGWRYNSDAAGLVWYDPATITGSFDASFKLMYSGDAALDGRPDGVEIGGKTGGPWDMYSAHLDFNKNLYSTDGWSNTYGGANYGFSSNFGAPVPEPATLMLLGLGALSLLRKRKA